MNMYELEVFAEQRMADRMHEAERERLIREARVGEPRGERYPAIGLAQVRRFARAARGALTSASPARDAQLRIPQNGE